MLWYRQCLDEIKFDILLYFESDRRIKCCEVKVRARLCCTSGLRVGIFLDKLWGFIRLVYGDIRENVPVDVELDVLFA